jgi:WhiB family redox-sensing transcriptional regulator
MPQPWNPDIGQDHARPEFVDARIACADVDPEIFFPPFGPGADYDQAVADRKHAKRICRGCTHRVACLRFALDTEQRFGIWGGTTPGERSAMIRRTA